MLEKIAKLDSLVLRGLLVAAVGFIGVVLSLFSVSEGMFSENAMKVVDAGMTLLTAVGLINPPTAGQISIGGVPVMDGPRASVDLRAFRRRICALRRGG